MIPVIALLSLLASANPAPENAADARLADALFAACPVLTGVGTEPPPGAEAVPAEPGVGPGRRWTLSSDGVEVTIEARRLDELVLTPVEADLVCVAGVEADGPAQSAAVAARLDAPGSGWRRVQAVEGLLPSFLQDRGRWISADGARLIESTGAHPSFGEGAALVAARLVGADDVGRLARLEAASNRPVHEALLTAIDRVCPLLRRESELTPMERRDLRTETQGAFGGYAPRHRDWSGRTLVRQRDSGCAAAARGPAAAGEGAAVLARLRASGSGWRELGERRSGDRVGRLFRAEDNRQLLVEVAEGALLLTLLPDGQDEIGDNSTR